MGRTAGEAVRISEVDPPAGAGRERRQGRGHLLRELVHPAAEHPQRPADPLPRLQPRLAIPVPTDVRPSRLDVPGSLTRIRNPGLEAGHTSERWMPCQKTPNPSPTPQKLHTPITRSAP